MQPPAAITDVWFRSPLGLRAIAETLGWSDVSFDAEDYWEWAIGAVDGVRLDATRPHAAPAASVDTRIVRVDNQPLSSDLRTGLVERARCVAVGPVFWGRWVYRQGNEFDVQAVGHVAAGE